MNRRKSRTPSYRRHAASGQARVTINGRDVYLGPHGSAASRANYDRVIAEWLANGRQVEPQPDGLTVSNLILLFWRHCQQYYRDADGSPTGEANNYHAALKYVRRLYGGTPASAFGPLALQAV